MTPSHWVIDHSALELITLSSYNLELISFILKHIFREEFLKLNSSLSNSEFDMRIKQFVFIFYNSVKINMSDSLAVHAFE